MGAVELKFAGTFAKDNYLKEFCCPNCVEHEYCPEVETCEGCCEKFLTSAMQEFQGEYYCLVCCEANKEPLRELTLKGSSEAEFAVYLNEKGYQPTQVTIDNLMESREEYYQRNQITNLDVGFRNLTGDLVLRDFANLVRFRCCGSELNSLDVSSYFLTKLSHPEKLINLALANNDFQTTSLEFLRPFTNLRSLFLGNNFQDKINQRIYNHFIGSLEPLRGMSKLVTLSINNTDIDSGLEYLPDSIEKKKKKQTQLIEAETKKTEDLEEQVEKLIKNNQELETQALNQAVSEQHNFSEQSNQLAQKLTEKEQQIKTLKEQIELLKQNQINTAELEAQLAQKEQELLALREKNVELTKQSELTNLNNQLEVIIQEQLIVSQGNKHQELLKNQEFYRNKPEAFASHEQVVNELQVDKPDTKEEITDKVEKQLTDSLTKFLRFKYSLNYGKHARADALAETLERIGGTEILNTATVGISGAVGKLTTIGNSF
ncbi:663_t:CDS:2 [Funneliformis geosporum]|nr:663_t:CDS:2 [Funneliformis geosporum]